MNLENLFEDLETRYESMQETSPTSLAKLGEVTISMPPLTLNLTQAHYGKDFVLGRSGATIYVVPHRAIKLLTFEQADGTESNRNLGSWLRTLNKATWLSLRIGERSVDGRFDRFESGLVFLENFCVPLVSIDLIEIRAVDNE